VNLVADEGIDRPVVDRLRRDGHHVVYVPSCRRALLTKRSSAKPIRGTRF
jgi:hypothetical protein